MPKPRPENAANANKVRAALAAETTQRLALCDLCARIGCSSQEADRALKILRRLGHVRFEMPFGRRAGWCITPKGRRATLPPPPEEHDQEASTHTAQAVRQTCS